MLKHLIQGALIGAILGIPTLIAFLFPVTRELLGALGRAAGSPVKLPEMLEVQDWVVFAVTGAGAAMIGDRVGSTTVVSLASWTAGLFFIYGGVAAALVGLLLGLAFDVINQKANG